jgi:Putative adhesin
MLRYLLITSVALAFVSGPAQAQSRRSGFGRSADEWCHDNGSGDRASHCEVREATIAANNPLDIDAGRNGGIHVRGADRSDAYVRARIVGYADTDAEARRIVAAVQIDTAGGRVRADGPGDDRWSVSFEVEVPRAAALTLNTHNGGIAIDDFRGAAQFRAQNGGVSLRGVGGDIRGTTTNGGVTIRLDGDRWDGAGLDVETRNGGIRMDVPASYSAELETGTTNGGVAIDFPVTLHGSVGRHFTTTLGAGGAKLRAITTNGGVSIHRTQ